MKSFELILEAFASKHRLTLKREDDPKFPGHLPTDRMTFIPGSQGDSQIYEYGEGKLGVLIMPHTGSVRYWNAAKAAFKSAGMVISQDGDEEGCATFDPSDKVQVKMAKKYARVRSKRKTGDVGQRLIANKSWDVGNRPEESLKTV